ncbi:NucA/NucB deoxyribonuclease domain-containing protein [Streptomyces parvulus]|uniref:NucA/NucB deoxyribonuclease domain-containing protein n=1 Tax=Streptomyces parvulus TaxID=146923 RepID=UPI003FD74D3A
MILRGCPPPVQGRGDRACPQAASGGYPRPADYSCDEYPFRSTWQGSFTGSLPQPAPYPGRTFSWCQISALPQNVTDGWSACMIPAGQNSSAGSLLNRFYIENRVIERDAFRVWIVA